MLHHTNDVVTVAEAAETTELTETKPIKYGMSGSQREKRGGSKAIFFYYK